MKGSTLLLMYLLRLCCCAAVARYLRALCIHFAHLAHCAHANAYTLFVAGPQPGSMASWLWAALALALMVLSLVEVVCIAHRLVQEFRIYLPTLRQRLARMHRRLRRGP